LFFATELDQNTRERSQARRVAALQQPKEQMCQKSKKQKVTHRKRSSSADDDGNDGDDGGGDDDDASECEDHASKLIQSYCSQVNNHRAYSGHGTIGNIILDAIHSHRLCRVYAVFPHFIRAHFHLQITSETGQTRDIALAMLHHTRGCAQQAIDILNANSRNIGALLTKHPRLIDQLATSASRVA
jgi:hypothetical protein